MSGHGWVVPNPGGLRARCGGPTICSVCRQELRELRSRNERAKLSIVDDSKPPKDWNAQACWLALRYSRLVLESMKSYYRLKPPMSDLVARALREIDTALGGL